MRISIDAAPVVPPEALPDPPRAVREEKEARRFYIRAEVELKKYGMTDGGALAALRRPLVRLGSHIQKLAEPG